MALRSDLGMDSIFGGWEIGSSRMLVVTDVPLAIDLH